MQKLHCGPADRCLGPLMPDGSVLGLPKAGVRSRHQDRQASVLPQLRTGTAVIARFQAAACEYWILHSQVQDHVL